MRLPTPLLLTHPLLMHLQKVIIPEHQSNHDSPYLKLLMTLIIQISMRVFIAYFSSFISPPTQFLVLIFLQSQSHSWNMLSHTLPLYMEESIEMQSIGQSEEGLRDRLIRYLNALGKESESCSVVSNSLWPHRPYSPWNSPGQNTGVSSCSLV